MALLEALALDLGASIAKSILKIWLKDSSIVADASSGIVDILKSQTKDRIAQQRVRRQFEIIGENVGESLLPLFESEGAHLDEGSCTSVALSVADTLNAVTSKILVQQNLEPSNLAKYLLSTYPAASYHFSETEKLLYERIVSESCIYIVDIASDLPPFTENAFAEVLKREDQLIKIANKTLEEMMRMREQMNPHAGAARFEEEYRPTVRRHMDVLELFGADVTAASRRHRLSVAYVTLSVEQKIQRNNHDKDDVPHSPTILGFTNSQPEVGRSIDSVNKALIGSQNLLIRGLAGSGKTTLLKWIAVNSAMRSFKEPLADWNNTLPFYIRLRECVDSGLPDTEDFPQLLTKVYNATKPPRWVRDALDAGQAIVLVDGLDEVPALQREKVRDWLKDLVAKFPRSRFIVTMRPHAAEEGWMDAEGFTEAVLQRMELPDIYAFIDHWHEAVAGELHDEKEKDQLHTFKVRLKREIGRDPAKRNLATSPLLCAMLCALNRDRFQQLPSDRIELYKACCELLIERRDLARGITLPEYPALALSYPQKRLLLEELAYWMIRNDRSEVEIERADEQFARKLASMPGLPQKISGTDARRFFDERSGIIRQPVAGRIDFTHRTFQEFLAAQAALDMGDIGVLVQNAHNDQWREMIVLASGLAPNKVREELIDQLIGQGDTLKFHRYQIHLLAAACLRESTENLELNVRNAIEKRLSRLVPPRTIQEAEALATAGKLAISFLHPQQDYSEEVAAACIHALALIGGDTAFEVLEEYATTTQPTVMYELFAGWDSFDTEKYAKRILINYEKTPELGRFFSLDGFQYLTKLTSLSLKDCSQVKDLSPLAGLIRLTSLSLGDCSQIKDLNPLTSLEQLTSLSLKNFDLLSDISPLTRLRNLRTLKLDSCPQLSDISPLISSPKLTTLSLRSCRQVQDLKDRVGIDWLTSLDLSGTSNITNLNCLADLTGLTSLMLIDFDHIKDLSPLAGLTHLTSLSLLICPHFKDLSPLACLTELRNLYIFDCQQIKDLTPLAGLTNIKHVTLRSYKDRSMSLSSFTIPNNLKGIVRILGK